MGYLELSMPRCFSKLKRPENCLQCRLEALSNKVLTLAQLTVLQTHIHEDLKSEDALLQLIYCSRTGES